MHFNSIDTPIVSFCMSTYKRPDFLKNQLSCILQQTYSNFEIVISDNDISRSGELIANSFQDNRIKYFCNAENLGMIKSFNNSIERSSGDFIIMITDDDPIYPNTVQTLINLYTQYPDYGVFAGCGDWIIDNKLASDTQKLNIGYHTRLSPDLASNEIRLIDSENFINEYINGIVSKSFLLWSCAMVKKEVLLKINGVPNYVSELLGDHAYIMLISSQNGMVFINKSLGGQLVHGANFGYEFYKVVDKYINTPALFNNYLHQQLSHKNNWNKNEILLWGYTGKAWVEYSLMLFHSLKGSKDTKRDFYIAFNKAFSNKKITKWKYKFYIKAYFPNIFKVLIKLKNLIRFI